MSAPDDPVTDPARLAALRATRLLDSPPEEAFDRTTRIAARLLGAPMATVTLVDADRQFFKSAVGLPEPMAKARQTPLSRSVCRHAVGAGTTLVIPDTRTHPLLREQPEVAEQGVVAYLGVPLRAPSGHVLGTLCVMDSQTRAWSGEDVRALEDLAAAAMVTLGQASDTPAPGASPPADEAAAAEAAQTAETAVLDVTSDLYWSAENYLERLADYDALVHAHDYARGAPLPAEEEVARKLVMLGERELRAATERYQETAPGATPPAEAPEPLQAVAASGRALWFAALAYFERQAQREAAGERFAAGEASLREVEEASTLARFAEGELRAAARAHAEARHLLAVSRPAADPE